VKKFLIASTVAAVLSASAAMAYDGPIAYPGSSYGAVIGPSAVLKLTPESNNVLYLAQIIQGVDWFRFAGNTLTFDTYGKVTFGDDMNHLTYNDKVAAAFGARVDRHFADGILTVGVEGVDEHHWGDGWNGQLNLPASNGSMNGFGVQAYASYWFGWNLKGK
jgi:hypothetical protein